MRDACGLVAAVGVAPVGPVGVVGLEGVGGDPHAATATSARIALIYLACAACEGSGNSSGLRYVVGKRGAADPDAARQVCVASQYVPGRLLAA